MMTDDCFCDWPYFYLHVATRVATCTAYNGSAHFVRIAHDVLFALFGVCSNSSACWMGSPVQDMLASGGLENLCHSMDFRLVFKSIQIPVSRLVANEQHIGLCTHWKTFFNGFPIGFPNAVEWFDRGCLVLLGSLFQSLPPSQHQAPKLALFQRFCGPL